MHKTVLFDLDGTLIDQFIAIHKSVNYVQKQLHLKESAFEEVKAAVGGSIRLTLDRLFNSHSLEETLPLFREHFESIMLEDVFLLPGVEPFLLALQRDSISMGILTNKIGSHARATIAHLNITSYFQSILGAEDIGLKKPDPKFTDHILELMNTSRESACIIGDSPFDYQTGVQSNMPVYLVASGTHSMEALQEETNGSHVYANMHALAKDVFNFNL